MNPYIGTNDDPHNMYTFLESEFEHLESTLLIADEFKGKAEVKRAKILRKY
jgi:hypothetical protein